MEDEKKLEKLMTRVNKLDDKFFDIRAGELKYLLEKTKEMDINRNMIVITNRGRNR